MNNAKEIFDKIKEKKIEPRSKWRFLLKDYLIWVFFGLAILIGSMAFSVIIFLLTDNDWDVYKYLDKSFTSYVILSFPYLWIIILASFSFLAYFNYRHTKVGYKINPIAIVLVSVLISIFLGSILFKSGFGQAIDYTFSKNIPYYEKMIIYRQALWSNPEKGLFAGRIIEINNKNNFYIKSLDGEKWQIVGDDILWKGSVPQELGIRIKIIGEIDSDNIFIANEIRPWIGKGGGMHRMRQ
jgi:hypothetical protein